jgi:hypothetical protein
VSIEPPQRSIAVLDWARMWRLWREPIVHRDECATNLARDRFGSLLVLVGAPEHVATTMNPQQPRQWSRNLLRTIDEDAHLRSACRARHMPFAYLNVWEFRQGRPHRFEHLSVRRTYFRERLCGEILARGKIERDGKFGVNEMARIQTA